MKRLRIAVPFALGLLAGCMAASPPPDPRTGAGTPESSGPLGSPFARAAGTAAGLGAPLLIDRTDLQIGTTVHFARVPSRSELHDLSQMLGLAHVVLALPGWPEGFANLQELDALPPESDLIVILPGYPPSRAAAEAWNQVGNPRLRVIVHVKTPPPNGAVVANLNEMRGLERVVAEIEEPSRTGFERLHRPLGFRKVMP
jgi:hypothetical protein